MLTGAAALPVAAVFTLTGKDYAQEDFNASWQLAYDAGLKAINSLGTLSSEDSAGGVINAEVKGAKVTIKLKDLTGGKTQITVSARKLMLPQPEVASGVMYKIREELK